MKKELLELLEFLGKSNGQISRLVSDMQDALNEYDYSTLKPIPIPIQIAVFELRTAEKALVKAILDEYEREQ